MKQSLAVFIVVFLGSFTSCKPNENTPIEGAYRNAHNCISSAGYNWSAVRGECVRIFEIGIELVDVENPDATFINYIVTNSAKTHVELFLANGDTVQLTGSAIDGWQNNTGTYRVKYDDQSGYSVFNRNKELLLVEENRVANDNADDELFDTGIVTSVTDGPYPMFVVTLEFPKREMSTSFDLNIENIDVSSPDLYAMVGQFVTIHYTSNLTHDLREMRFGDTFLLGTNPDEIQPDWKMVTGKLSGADAPTMSDLPGHFIIQGADDHKTKFEYFIPDEFVAANTQQVTAYYELRAQHIITKITDSAN